ncbi:MAG: 2-C-methyl-D-erythritol 4-phosphate cytidylyltransferase [Planctomycetes bacterium]|nr:2-C-methyl-D-erythritol 4-phosphate cytidylyltransferase [Planctomycetota bacterium]
MAKNVAVIICAAGSSRRFSGKKKKQYSNVDGRAAFLHSVELFSGIDSVKQIILAIAPDDQETVKVNWGPNLQFFNVKICLGGSERFETVKNAIELVKDDIDLIAVHDAVRCCTRKQWVEDCFKAAEETDAAILACPVVATVKKVEDNAIAETIDRTNLYEAQTPQVFSVELLKKAYDNLDNLDKAAISDDSQLVEALGHKVAIVKTDSSNIKITQSADIYIAQAIIKSRPKPTPKGPTGPYNEAQW